MPKKNRDNTSDADEPSIVVIKSVEEVLGDIANSPTSTPSTPHETVKTVIIKRAQLVRRFLGNPEWEHFCSEPE